MGMTLFQHTGRCIQVYQTHSHRKDSMGPVSSHKSQEAVWTIAGSMAKTSSKCTKNALAPYSSTQAIRFHIGSLIMSSPLKSQVWWWLRCMSLPRNSHWPSSLRVSTLSNQSIPVLRALLCTVHTGLGVRILTGRHT